MGVESAKRKKKSTGRRHKDAKRDRVEQQYDIYWTGVDREQCVLHREQFAWRIVDGKAVYVAYQIYDLPDSKELPLPTGLRNSRSEFGIEIILVLAFLHYWIGMSIDHACEVMQFFTELELPKLQADSLLSQLAADWNEQQYATFLDDLCEIYQQAVCYQKDGRLSIGREEKAYELQGNIRSLCTRHGEIIIKDVTPDSEATFIRLQNELVNNLSSLFVFVEHPEVEPTNNRSERNVRREAEVRKGGRTSKTSSEAKRRGVIMTVLASLQTRFSNFTLNILLTEVEHWLAASRSILESELSDLQKANAPPTSSIPLPAD